MRCTIVENTTAHLGDGGAAGAIVRHDLLLCLGDSHVGNLFAVAQLTTCHLPRMDQAQGENKEKVAAFERDSIVAHLVDLFHFLSPV